MTGCRCKLTNNSQQLTNKYKHNHSQLQRSGWIS